MPIQTPADYHLKTAYERFRMGEHPLEWSNQPNVYKTYSGIPSVSLSPGEMDGKRDFWETVAQAPEAWESPGRSIDITTLARVLFLSHGLTARARYSDQDFFYRSVASAGALYPNEIYVAAVQVEGLEAGLYHYRIKERELVPLRLSPVGGYLSGAVDLVCRCKIAAYIFVTGIFFRSAWKYRERAYRYVALDAGHLVENLLLVLQAEKLVFSSSYDFNDQDVASLLGIDNKREACLACVGILEKDPKTDQPGEKHFLAPVSTPAASLVANKEIVYKDILEIHEAGMTEKIDRNPGTFYEHDLGLTDKQDITMPQYLGRKRSKGLIETIVSRRSKRNFVYDEMPLLDFTDLLHLLCHTRERIPGSKKHQLAVHTGMLVGSVEGFDPGFYIFDYAKSKIGLIDSGEMTGIMASVCLDQMWLASAGVHFLFIANLDFLDELYGARGYRYAMLEAGRMGHILYLGATAMGLGCCGIGAFYDFEAKELLQLEGNSYLLYLVGVGRVKK